MKILILTLTLFCSSISYSKDAVSEILAEPRTIYCKDPLSNNYAMAILKIDKDENLIELNIITPEHKWTTPDQPGTPQAPEGFSLETPNLVKLPKYKVSVLRDAQGSIRIIDFGPLESGAIEIEGFSGSIAFHVNITPSGTSEGATSVQGSIHYISSLNPIASVYPTVCEELPGI